MKTLKNSQGQAVVEYLIIFAFMGVIGIKMAQAINSTFGKSIGNLGLVLTQKLTTGVCPNRCFFNGYKNKGGQ